MSALSPFVLLQDASTYVACDWDLAVDAGGRNHWVGFFLKHFEVILNLAIEAEVARGKDPVEVNGRVTACRAEFRERFTNYGEKFTAFGRVTILTLDQWRDEILRRHGIVDAFELLKERENAKMLPLVPVVCRQLDAMSPAEQRLALIEGVFAGNIFDMGAEATAKAFLGASPDFFAVREKLQKRPWLFDDFDAVDAKLAAQAAGRGWKKVVFFVDNAGSDFLLGALPLMRWLALRGAKVVLVANERPTLNDMTVAEVRKWWPRVVEVEGSFGSLPIEVVSSGTGEPLIDLLGVSAELNRAAEGADLVIIEGMGRGVESNLYAKFKCDAMNLAMLKDRVIAERHGGKVFDCVCRFRGAGE